MIILYEHIRDIADRNFNGVVVYLLLIYKYYKVLLSNRLLPLIEQILLQQSIDLDIPVDNNH